MHMHMHNNLHKLSKHFQSPARNFTNTGSDPLVNEKANAKKFSVKNSKTKGQKNPQRQTWGKESNDNKLKLEEGKNK